jgi:hypothetical protein
MKPQLKISLLVILAAMVLACNFPFLSPEHENIFKQPAQTLTAMVQVLTTPTAIIVNPTVQLSTATSMPINTQLPTFTPIPTRQPTFTPISTQQPGPHRTGNWVTARFLNSPPVIDGIWDEWKNLTPLNLAGYVINGAGNWKNPADLIADFILGWDTQYLYLGLKISDDVYVQNSTGAYLYKGDDVELQLDTNLGVDFVVKNLNNDDYQLGISAGRGSLSGPKEAYLWYPKIIQDPVSDTVLIASQPGSGFHFVEVRIHWSLFAVSPYAGLRMGFALALSDNDNPSINNWQTMIANTPRRKTTDPTTWGELHLIL